MSPDRFEDQFTKEQAEVMAAELDRIRDALRASLRRTLLVFLTAVLFATGWVYHQLDAQQTTLRHASQAGDQATRQLAALNRARAAEAKTKADAAKAQAEKAAEDAYSSCRLQQHAAIAQRKALHVLLLDPDPAVHAAAGRYADYLQAQHLLDVPTCTKPPKGTGS